MSEPLSYTEETTPSYTRYYLIAVVVVAALVIAYFIFGGGSPPPPPDTKQKPDDPVRMAREALGRATDLTTCREALTQTNQVLNRQGISDAARPSVPPPVEQIRQRFELRDDEWTEISSESFTLLDGHHLQTAFVFRDAATSFTRDGVLEDSSPLRRAELAFDWAVRQVRLPEGRDQDAEPLPLDFVLRRGFGTSIERSLVFLALLQQLDLPGCMIAMREPVATSFPLWACGVLIGQDIYLFDPRMGIPVPGPNGMGVATLAAVQNQPDLLKQLSSDGYDVTSEQARKARLYVALPLSALAPRMLYLEKLLQDTNVPAPVVAGRLGVDALQVFKQWENALAHTGIKNLPPVQAWPSAARTLRAVLSAEEGGLDKSHDKRQPSRMEKMRYSIVPIQYFPQIINRDMLAMFDKMALRFSDPFVNLVFGPNQPRDLLLRGRFDESSRLLTTLRNEATTNAARVEGNKELMGRAADALKKMQEAFGNLLKAERQGDPNIDALRANVDAVLREGQGWVDACVDGCAALPLGQEVSYQLALTKHEQAVRLQLRVEFPSRAGAATGSEADEARRAWLNAADWWTTYLSKYADASTAPAARLQASRAWLMLGERDSALDLLREHSKLTDLEKVGRIIMARQLEKKSW
jgi:hypothetical protein